MILCRMIFGQTQSTIACWSCKLNSFDINFTEDQAQDEVVPTSLKSYSLVSVEIYP